MCNYPWHLPSGGLRNEVELGEEMSSWLWHKDKYPRPPGALRLGWLPELFQIRPGRWGHYISTSISHWMWAVLAAGGRDFGQGNSLQPGNHSKGYGTISEARAKRLSLNGDLIWREICHKLIFIEKWWYISEITL